MYVLVVLKLDRRIVDSKGDVKMETNAKSNDGRGKILRSDFSISAASAHM
jgi:hypothetical protein